MEDRVAIFIDGSNLYHALRANVGRYDLNFAEFARKLCGERRLFRTYYYNVLQDPSQRAEGYREQQEFLNALRNTPYLEVRLGGTKLAQGIPVEKGIDVMLVTDLLHFAWNGLYDVAVLVSGDSDFAYALQLIIGTCWTESYSRSCGHTSDRPSAKGEGQVGWRPKMAALKGTGMSQLDESALMLEIRLAEARGKKYPAPF